MHVILAYTVTKGGVRSLSTNSALNYRAEDIRVNRVAQVQPQPAPYRITDHQQCEVGHPFQ